MVNGTYTTKWSIECASRWRYWWLIIMCLWYMKVLCMRQPVRVCFFLFLRIGEYWYTFITKTWRLHKIEFWCMVGINVYLKWWSDILEFLISWSEDNKSNVSHMNMVHFASSMFDIIMPVCQWCVVICPFLHFMSNVSICDLFSLWAYHNYDVHVLWCTEWKNL